MGNSHSGQNFLKRKKNSERKIMRFGSGSTSTSAIIVESSSGSDQLLSCASQSVTSSYSSETSARLPVKSTTLLSPCEAVPLVSNIPKTYHEQQRSGPSEEVDHIRDNNKNKSTLPQGPLPQSPPKQGPKSGCPTTPPQLKTSASPEKLSSMPTLAETVLLLEKPKHAAKETKDSVRPTVTAICPPESKSEESATLSLSAAAQSSNILVSSGCGGENKPLSGDSHGQGRGIPLGMLPQTDSRTEYVNTQKAPSESDMRAVLPGAPFEEPRLKRSPAGTEREVKHDTKQVRINTCTSKKPNLLEPVQSSTEQTPANQAEDPTRAQNNKGLSISESVSHINGETSVVAPAIKSERDATRTATLSPSRTSATATYEERPGHQSLTEERLLTKDCITVSSTNNISASHAPSSAAASSRHSRPGGSLKRRMKTKPSVSKAVAKTPDVLHSDNERKERKDQMRKEVQEEIRGGAEEPGPPTTGDINDNVSKIKNVYTFGESRFKTFPELKGVLDQSRSKKPAQGSGSRSLPLPKPSSSSVFSQAHSATPDGQVPEKCATGGEVCKKNRVTSEVDREVPPDRVQDSSRGPRGLLAAPRAKTKAKRKHGAKTMRRKTSKAEVKTEKTPAPPASPTASEHPAHPEGRWHPFTKDPTCTRRRPHRGGALLPRNVRRWLDVKDNYLCEPPWATTATLAASLAFWMKQEKSDFLL